MGRLIAAHLSISVRVVRTSRDIVALNRLRRTTGDDVSLTLRTGSFFHHQV